MKRLVLFLMVVLVFGLVGATNFDNAWESNDEEGKQKLVENIVTKSNPQSFADKWSDLSTDNRKEFSKLVKLEHRDQFLGLLQIESNPGRTIDYSGFESGTMEYFPADVENGKPERIVFTVNGEKFEINIGKQFKGLTKVTYSESKIRYLNEENGWSVVLDSTSSLGIVNPSPSDYNEKVKGRNDWGFFVKRSDGSEAHLYAHFGDEKNVIFEVSNGEISLQSTGNMMENYDGAEIRAYKYGEEGRVSRIDRFAPHPEIHNNGGYKKGNTEGTRLVSLSIEGEGKYNVKQGNWMGLDGQGEKYGGAVFYGDGTNSGGKLIISQSGETLELSDRGMMFKLDDTGKVVFVKTQGMKGFGTYDVTKLQEDSSSYTTLTRSNGREYYVPRGDMLAAAPRVSSTLAPSDVAVDSNDALMGEGSPDIALVDSEAGTVKFDDKLSYLQTQAVSLKLNAAGFGTLSPVGVDGENGQRFEDDLGNAIVVKNDGSIHKVESQSESKLVGYTGAFGFRVRKNRGVFRRKPVYRTFSSTSTVPWIGSDGNFVNPEVDAGVGAGIPIGSDSGSSSGSGGGSAGGGSGSTGSSSTGSGGSGNTNIPSGGPPRGWGSGPVQKVKKIGGFSVPTDALTSEGNVRVFVYGTLREGKSNFGMLGVDSGSGTRASIQGTMSAIGSLKAVELSGTGTIQGEVYEVSEANLGEVNEMEHKAGYDFKPVKIGGRTVMVYTRK